ncbi:di-/tricarboxylate transporter [Lachnospiraceae bacterium JC7]|nr:di-/tricarboxylate transporter [Lachnospiraceae bacterium JC7]
MNAAQITLIIGIFMLISYILGKLPYGMTAIACCLALDITGVLTTGEAWGGFGNSTVFLFAAVFVLGAGFMKTSFTKHMHNFVKKYGNSESKVRWICMIMSSILSMLTSATASGATMLPMLDVICEQGNYSKSRIYKAVMDVSCISFAIMPFGMGAAFIEQGNEILEASGDALRMSVLDSAIVRIPVLICVILYIGLIGYRFLPDNKLTVQEEHETVKKTKKELDPLRDKLGIIIFFASIIAMVISSFISVPSHYAALAGSLLMVATGVLTGKEAFQSIDLNTVCIFGGSLSFSTAMTKTGLAASISDALSSITNQNMSQILLVAIFLLVPFCMTQFMGNIPVINLTMPIAAAIAVGGGFNPTAIMIATIAGATLSVATPMAAGIQALIMGPADYKFTDYLKAGLPVALVYLIVYAVWAPIAFPLF